MLGTGLTESDKPGPCAQSAPRLIGGESEATNVQFKDHSAPMEACGGPMGTEAGRLAPP